MVRCFYVAYVITCSYKSEETSFYVFFYLQINVFDTYELN